MGEGWGEGRRIPGRGMCKGPALRIRLSGNLGIVEEPGRRWDWNCETRLYCGRILDLMLWSLHLILLEQSENAS